MPLALCRAVSYFFLHDVVKGGGVSHRFLSRWQWKILFVQKSNIQFPWSRDGVGVGGHTGFFLRAAQLFHDAVTPGLTTSWKLRCVDRPTDRYRLFNLVARLKTNKLLLYLARRKDFRETAGCYWASSGSRVDSSRCTASTVPAPAGRAPGPAAPSCSDTRCSEAPALAAALQQDKHDATNHFCTTIQNIFKNRDDHKCVINLMRSDNPHQFGKIRHHVVQGWLLWQHSCTNCLNTPWSRKVSEKGFGCCNPQFAGNQPHPCWFVPFTKQYLWNTTETIWSFRTENETRSRSTRLQLGARVAVGTAATPHFNRMLLLRHWKRSAQPHENHWNRCTGHRELIPCETRAQQHSSISLTTVPDIECITAVCSSLCEHANCNDQHIDQAVENGTGRFVLTMHQQVRIKEAGLWMSNFLQQ